jgi:hypothetical protein
LFEILILSMVTSSRVNFTSQPSTNAGSPEFTGGNGYPVSASTSPDAANKIPPAPGSFGGVNDASVPGVDDRSEFDPAVGVEHELLFEHAHDDVAPAPKIKSAAIR